MQQGLFTTALHLSRAALNLLGRLFDLFASLGGGLVSEIIAVALIWIIIAFGLPLIELLIKAVLGMLRLWR